MLRLDHAYGRGLTREGQKLTPKKMYTSSLEDESRSARIIVKAYENYSTNEIALHHHKISDLPNA